jgi:hypothetical protein
MIHRAPFGLVLVMAAGAAAVLAQEGGAQWHRVPEVCRQLQADGWKPEDPLGRGAGPAEVRVGGGLAIDLCRVTRTLDGEAGRRTPASLTVFMQHRGGDALSVTGRFYEEAGRQRTLDAVAAWSARLAILLDVDLPADVPASIRRGEERHGGVSTGSCPGCPPARPVLTYEVAHTTRQSELVSQPDLKPEDVPLATVTLTVQRAGDR